MLKQTEFLIRSLRKKHNNNLSACITECDEQARQITDLALGRMSHNESSQQLMFEAADEYNAAKYDLQILLDMQNEQFGFTHCEVVGL